MPSRESDEKRIGVLYAIEDLNVGGAERLLIEIATGLDRTLFAPVVCCLSTSGTLGAEVEMSGVPLIVLGKRRGIDLGVVWRLASIIRRYNIDVVHTHLFTADLWGRIAGLLTGVRVQVSTEHSFGLWKDRKRRWVDRLTVPFATKIIAVTDAIEDHLVQNRKVPSGKVTVINNAVGRRRTLSAEERRQVRADLEVDETAPLLCTVGRLSPEKGHALFLQAAQRILADEPRARFLVVGGGPCEEDLLRQASELGIQDAVRFTGVRSEVHPLLAASDLFVLPSKTEGLSMALLEAMEAGLPVVATNVGGTPDLVKDGETGLLVPSGDAAALAAACRGLLLDPDRGERLIRGARKAVRERYAMDDMLRQTEAVYRTALLN